MRSRAKELFQRGDKVGELRVLFPLGKNSNGSRLWACRCSCGSSRVVSYVALNRAVREAGYMACLDCWVEHRRWQLRNWKADNPCHMSSWKRRSFLTLWGSVRSMYSDGWERAEMLELRRAVARDMGFYPDRLDAVPAVDGVWQDETRSAVTESYEQLNYAESEGLDWFKARGVVSELPVMDEHEYRRILPHVRPHAGLTRLYGRPIGWRERAFVLSVVWNRL